MVMTWKCHICGERREDEHISVHSKDISKELNLEKGVTRQNVRYCNDKPECKTKAYTYDFLKQKKN